MMPGKNRYPHPYISSFVFLFIFSFSLVRNHAGTLRVASELDRPVYLTAPVGDVERLFIVEQHSGQIKILKFSTGLVHSPPFLTITNLSKRNEQGLLGLAFHPDYSKNGYFFVNLTIADGSSEIRRYQVSQENPDLANPESETLMLTYSQPASNHNGGWLGFGPDGFLYISSGDGGGSNDEGAGHTPGTGNAQDITNNLLGKMLRINVNSDDFPEDITRNYAIPASNPFVDAEGDDEIWAYGLRNPWRSSFDRQTGDFYIADVGQGDREEINFQINGISGGQNYAWRLREGFIATPKEGIGGNRPANAVDPVYEYPHGFDQFEGFSVTGGYVYRGKDSPIFGHYVFADYLSEQIWSIQVSSTTGKMIAGSLRDLTVEFSPDTGSINKISSFGEDAEGNLYILDLGGEIFKYVPDLIEITCPPDASISCDESFDPTTNTNLGNPSVSSRGNGQISIDFSDDSSAIVDCNGSYDILRTWSATNGIGNMSTCIQTITVTDSLPPVITCPPDQEFPCNVSIDPLENTTIGIPLVSDNCDLEPSISFNDLPASLPGCVESVTIQRTWTVTDHCGYSVSCNQEIGRKNRSSLQISLTKGWNLMSVPIHPDKSIHDLLGDHLIGKIWRWQNSKYKQVDPLVPFEPKVGYWIFVDEEYSLLLDGILLDQVKILLQPSWNLVGPGCSACNEHTILSFDDALPPESRHALPLWNWKNQKFEAVTSLALSKGYWVYQTP